MLTFEQIKELIQLVADRRLSVVELERSGFRLRIDGQAVAPIAAPLVAPPPAPAAPVAASMAAAESVSPPAERHDAAPAPEVRTATALPANAFVQRSPMVGTFYRSPSPEAPSFVEVGQRVKKGQTFCILEAMKLMNEIEAEADGVITEIYPANATAVEFGEALCVIVP